MENQNTRGSDMKKTESSNRKCFNCKHASEAFTIGSMTHHQCLHPKHEDGLKGGTISPWDTLKEFHDTCESHEFKTAQ
jgi:hypothetical protein